MKNTNEVMGAISYFDLALKLATEINQVTENVKDIDKILELTRQILQVNK